MFRIILSGDAVGGCGGGTCIFSDRRSHDRQSKHFEYCKHSTVSGRSKYLFKNISYNNNKSNHHIKPKKTIYF